MNTYIYYNFKNRTEYNFVLYIANMNKTYEVNY